MRIRGSAFAARDVSGRLLIPLVESGAYDSLNLTQGLDVIAGLYGWNEDASAWERVRVNQPIWLLASFTRTGNTNTSTQTNYSARGILLTLDVTARTVGASPLIRITIQVRDPRTGGWQDYVQTADFDPTVDTHLFLIYPGADLGGSGISIPTTTHAIAAPIPRTWRAVVEFVADVTDLTYSLDGYLLI